MSKVYLEDSELTAIGNAIRDKTGTSSLLLPSAMPSAIAGITTGGGEIVFKHAVITPTTNNYSINLSPWITDENIDDWFMCGGFGAYQLIDVNNAFCCPEVIGPIFRHVATNTYGWKGYAVVPKSGSYYSGSQTSSNMKFDVHNSTSWTSPTARGPSWDPTTKVISWYPSAKCLAWNPIQLYYREV